MNRALFLLAATSYVLYPVWHLPIHAVVQWGLLNIFILISAAVLYSPLDEVALELPQELGEFWPAMLAAAAVCLPFWLTPLPSSFDDQSHSGPAAWLLGRAATAAGLDIRLLPLIFIPLAALLFAAWRRLYKSGLRFPGKKAAVLALAAGGNLWFFADLRFSAADAIGRYETILRYPPLSKFLYLLAYLLLGVTEAAPRAVQFIFIGLTAAYLLRLLRLVKASPPPALTYLLIAFFPTFFNLSISTELEAGTVFFFTAAIFHFIRAAEDGDRRQFLRCSFWTAAGFFYKQLPLGLMLSFIPALAALRLLRPSLRAEWTYGFKTLLIPAAVGLPFILLGARFGIRGTGIIAAYLSDPYMMTINLRAVYLTCGALLAALLAASAAYALLRRRCQALWLLLYLAGAYYVMISATAAAGYLRHAQPFFILPVFLLALGAAAAGERFPRLKTPLWGALLGLLLFQSALARSPYQRKTAFNFRENVLPYREAALYLRDLHLRGLRIYAPMEVEPSHFYLAKYGLAGKVAWDRTLPPSFSAAKAAETFRRNGYDFILLPYSPFPALQIDFAGIADELKASGEFSEEKIFEYSGNRLVLLKPSNGPGKVK